MAATSVLDGYLLGEPLSKPVVVATLLAERSSDLAAAPFYRALEAVGTRAADEALIALRLVLAGRPPSDVSVRRLRALAAVARASARDDAGGLNAVLRRDERLLTDLPDKMAGLGALGQAAREAYLRELES